MLADLLVLVVLIGINAFFAAAEIAFISLNDNKMKKQAEEGDKKSKQIIRLLKEPSKFFATIQIGITLAGFLASAFAAETFAQELVLIFQDFLPAIPVSVVRTVSMLLITIALSYFTLVFGELVPKRLALKYGEKIANMTVGFISFLSKLTRPFVALLTFSTNFFSGLLGCSDYDEEKVTEEEIRMMVDVGEENGSIQPEEKEMINNIFEFNDTVAAQIMIPRINIVSVGVEATIEEIIQVIDSAKLSRVPVYEETIDHIIGILNIKELIPYISSPKRVFCLRELLREPFFVPEAKKIHELFKEMQKQQHSMAIVLDEYGGTSGIISMEDILEEIVGNIFDEYDEVKQDFEEIDENHFRIQGAIRLDEVEKMLKVSLPSEEYDTLSGFIIGQLGRIPEENEKAAVVLKEVTFEVEKCEEKRIDWVRAYKHSQEKEDVKDLEG